MVFRKEKWRRRPFSVVAKSVRLFQKDAHLSARSLFDGQGGRVLKKQGRRPLQCDTPAASQVWNVCRGHRRRTAREQVDPQPWILADCPARAASQRLLGVSSEAHPANTGKVATHRQVCWPGVLRMTTFGTSCGMTGIKRRSHPRSASACDHQEMMHGLRRGRRELAEYKSRTKTRLP